MNLTISEISVLRRALNNLWYEKDRMSDLHWIQQVRKKLNEEEGNNEIIKESKKEQAIRKVLGTVGIKMKECLGEIIEEKR